MYTQFQNLASATGPRPLLDGTHVQVWVTPSLHLKMSAIPGADDGVTRSWKTIFKCEHFATVPHNFFVRLGSSSAHSWKNTGSYLQIVYVVVFVSTFSKSMKI
jgi:hypothetical protein